MTRLNRILNLLEQYDRLLCIVLNFHPKLQIEFFNHLGELRCEKKLLTQELIEHGCRRKN